MLVSLCVCVYVVCTQARRGPFFLENKAEFWTYRKGQNHLTFFVMITKINKWFRLGLGVIVGNLGKRSQPPRPPPYVDVSSLLRVSSRNDTRVVPNDSSGSCTKEAKQFHKEKANQGMS